MSVTPTKQTTAPLPQDLRALGFPVCDRAADEIEWLRAELAKAQAMECNCRV